MKPLSKAVLLVTRKPRKHTEDGEILSCTNLTCLPSKSETEFVTSFQHFHRKDVCVSYFYSGPERQGKTKVIRESCALSTVSVDYWATYVYIL